ncbi:serine/arginine repetitive matrix protein 1-like [Microplitis demolitor]|uniref:serine/arginine repetitive matrix protein 1-like n=1 Tax=Microplitis demolitor TaxID=69319 RepID=UPI00235B649C|nr:serine/arginine repetitive matrix protein 1-like [Microplitis demolitor]
MESGESGYKKSDARRLKSVIRQQTSKQYQESRKKKKRNSAMERQSRSTERKQTNTVNRSRSSSSSSSISSSSSNAESQVTSTTGSPSSTGRFKERSDTPNLLPDMPMLESLLTNEQQLERKNDKVIEIITLEEPEQPKTERQGRATRQATLKVQDAGNKPRKIVVDFDNLEEQRVTIRGKERMPLLEPPFSRITRAKFGKHAKVSLTEMSREERGNLTKGIVSPLTKTIDEVARGEGVIPTSRSEQNVKAVKASVNAAATVTSTAQLQETPNPESKPSKLESTKKEEQRINKSTLEPKSGSKETKEKAKSTKKEERQASRPKTESSAARKEGKPTNLEAQEKAEPAAAPNRSNDLRNPQVKEETQKRADDKSTAIHNDKTKSSRERSRSPKKSRPSQRTRATRRHYTPTRGIPATSRRLTTPERRARRALSRFRSPIRRWDRQMMASSRFHYSGRSTTCRHHRRRAESPRRISRKIIPEIESPSEEEIKTSHRDPRIPNKGMKWELRAIDIKIAKVMVTQSTQTDREVCDQGTRTLIESPKKQPFGERMDIVNVQTPPYPPPTPGREDEVGSADSTHEVPAKKARKEKRKTKRRVVNENRTNLLE